MNIYAPSPASAEVTAKTVSVGPLTTKLGVVAVLYKGRMLPLGNNGMRLLEILLTAPGQYMPRSRIMNTVWPEWMDRKTHVLESMKYRLMQTLNACAPGVRIHTLQTASGSGYVVYFEKYMDAHTLSPIGNVATQTVHVESFEIRLGAVAIFYKDRLLPLKRKEIQLLGFLLTEPGRYFSRREIMAAVWPEWNPTSQTHTLESTKYRLNQTLKERVPDVQICMKRLENRFDPSGYTVCFPDHE